ncbi:hypothetical protein IG631_15816 [Alternaria alternata]|nr:hypothetical protein IG631_15816 [Alternaria alternata]
MEMVRLVKGREQYVNSEGVMFNESSQSLVRLWIRKNYNLQFFTATFSPVQGDHERHTFGNYVIDTKISRGGDLRASVIAGLTFLG